MFGMKLKPKKLLKRKDFINSVDSKKIWSKSLNVEDVLNLLNNLKQEISKYDFDRDNNVIMTGRRKGLRDMIFERLNGSNNQYEENIKDSLFNLWEFVSDEYDGDLIFVSKELNLTLNDTINMCEKYRKNRPCKI